MKIIFLDIDGVLNCEKTEERLNGMLGIDRILLHRYHEMIREINLFSRVDTVISSSWRRHSDLMKEIERSGINYIGYTPYLLHPENGSKMERGHEIKQWIESRPHMAIDRYAILDDDADMLEGQPLFQTSFQKGLTPKIVRQVINHFKEPTNLYTGEIKLKSVELK